MTVGEAHALGGELVNVGCLYLRGSIDTRIAVTSSVQPGQRRTGDVRAVAQGVITLFISIGQLIGAALIGAVAASTGSGAAGYRQAFLVVAAIAGVLSVLAFGLKSRRAEQAGRA